MDGGWEDVGGVMLVGANEAGMAGVGESARGVTEAGMAGVGESARGLTVGTVGGETSTAGAEYGGVIC